MKNSLNIMAETNQYIAVIKPAGLIVEDNPYENSLEKEVKKHLRPNEFLGIIHRLDRVTSGIVLMAKRKGFLKSLNAQFANKQVNKTYYAIVQNRPPKNADTLNHFLFKNQKEKRTEVTEKPTKGYTEAQLHYRILKEIGSNFLLEIHPKTGRFHQIRAQLSHINCPILGDEKYGAPSWNYDKSIALHASKLAFQHPTNGKMVHLKAELPNRMHPSSYP